MTTTTPAPGGQLHHLDPATLIIDTNVRRDAGLTSDFLLSLKEHGVIQPVRGYRAQDGSVHVITGQRRTLGALQAGLATIPVYVTDSATGQEELAVQITENLHRAHLTDADTAAGIEQLAAFGLDAKQIAQSLAMTHKQVKHTRAVSATTAGTKALQAGMTIDQATILAQFSDHPDALEQLEEIAATEPERLPHAAANAHSRIEREQARAAEDDAIRERGLTILDGDPSWDRSVKAVPVSELTRADGTPATEDDADAVYPSGYRNVYAVTNWKKAGFSRNGSAPGGGMTEEQKAQRREIIENNRLMNDANQVRRQWLTDTLAETKLPAKAAHWAAATLAARPTHLHAETAANLLGKDTPAEMSTWAGKTPTKATNITLALAISTIEGYLHKSSWRTDYPEAATVAYLSQLETWGYHLADIERTITEKK